MKTIMLFVISMLYSCSLNKVQNKLLVELLDVQYVNGNTEYIFEIQNNSKENIPIRELIFFYEFKIFDNNNTGLYPKYKSEAIYSTNISQINTGKNIVVVKDKGLERFKLEKNIIYKIEFSLKYSKIKFYFNKNLEIK